MKYSHEVKHEISREDIPVLRARLGAFMRCGSRVGGGAYRVRSVCFDTPFDNALRDKIDGVSLRENYLIRLYNGDASYISLDKKSMMNNLCALQSCAVSEKEARCIAGGDIEWLRDCDRQLCRELYTRITSQDLKPATIIDCTCESFAYPTGNVRVTLNYDIRTCDFCADFLDPAILAIPAGDSPVMLEIKWDDFLPDIIRDAVTVTCRCPDTFSKYMQYMIC